MSEKHAYLLMCHTNFEQLNILLDLLDDERNDIYLHIDKKSKGYSVDDIRSHAVHSHLIFVEPMRVNWGGDTQIKLELKLLAEATKTPHAYYHLISGMDLPLKTQDEIHAFFAVHAGSDFIGLEKDKQHNVTKSFMIKLKYYYFLQNHVKRDTKSFLNRVQRKFTQLQQSLKIDRTKKTTAAFMKGASWFSITHDTACFILSEFDRYKKMFRCTLCADEIFVQTIMVNSPRIDSVIDDSLRCVDWTRGEPYTFRSEDYDMLMGSGKLFARKFDENVDRDIIIRIRDTLMSRE